MTFVVRTLEPDEVLRAHDLFSTALLHANLVEPRRSLAQESYLPGLTFGAFDHDHLVGTAGGFPFTMTLPGGARVPTTGVSRVGVAPTHTRRGLLRELMRTQLDGVAGRGESLASLRASETTIYGRFGYGIANQVVDLKIDRSRAARRHVGAPGRMRLVPKAEAVEVITPLHDRVGRRRPGSVDRAGWLQARWAHDLTEGNLVGAAYFTAVHENPEGALDGYVNYGCSTDDWEDTGRPIEVHDLFGASLAVEAALWGHLLDLDLCSTITAEMRPLDDPIRWLVNDQRAVKVTQVHDEIWLRLVDVEAALAARSYHAAEAVVLQVDDPLRPVNSGCYEVSPDGVARTEREPDLHLGVDVLGAAYLGGTTFTTLAGAGRLDEVRAGGTTRADRLFWWPEQPWCGTFF